MLSSAWRSATTRPLSRALPAVFALGWSMTACSTFSPAPYYDPPYYIDDLGRVYYSEGHSAYGTGGLQPAYGTPGRYQFDPYFSAFGHGYSLTDRSGFWLTGRGYYQQPFFALPGIRPPITGQPPLAPTDPPLEAPRMSPLRPALPGPALRRSPEPTPGSRNTGPGGSNASRPVTRPRPGVSRPGRSGPARAKPRAQAPKPRPRPAPSRPREIDPR